MTTPTVAAWFEIPAADFARAVRFYETVFAIALTREGCPNTGQRLGIFPHADGAASGCIIEGDGLAPGATGTVVYLNGGDDLAGPLGRVAAAGGTVLVPKTLITEEIGHFALFTDSEGNRVGLHSRH